MAGLTKYERWKKENPNGTPYEAFMAGVIDEAKYNEMTKQVEEYTEIARTVIDKEFDKHHEAMGHDTPAKASPKVTIIETVAAQPKLGTPTPTKNDMGYLRNKKSGKRTRMSMESVIRMVNKMPHIYERG